jgi:hypothetical protein
VAGQLDKPGETIDTDAVLIILDSSGNEIAYKSIKTAGEDIAYSLASDSDGKIWVVGKSGTESFVKKYDLELTEQFSKQIDDSLLRAIAVDLEEIYLGGGNNNGALLMKIDAQTGDIKYGMGIGDDPRGAVMDIDFSPIEILYLVGSENPLTSFISTHSSRTGKLKAKRIATDITYFTVDEGSLYAGGKNLATGKAFVAKFMTVPAGGVELPVPVGEDVVMDFTPHGIDVKVTIELVLEEGTMLTDPQLGEEIPEHARRLAYEEGLKKVTVGEYFYLLQHTAQIAGEVRIEMAYDPALLPTQDYWKIVGGWLWDEEFVLWEPMPTEPVDPLKDEVIAIVNAEEFLPFSPHYLVSAVIEYPKLAIEKLKTEIVSQPEAFKLDLQTARAVNQLLGQALQGLGRISSLPQPSAAGPMGAIMGARKLCEARNASGYLTRFLTAVYHAIKTAYQIH